MDDITVLVLITLASGALSLLLGFLFNKMRVQKVKYYVSDDQDDKVDQDEDDLEDQQRRGQLQQRAFADVQQKYPRFLRVSIILGIAWAILGVLLTILAYYRESFLSSDDISGFSSILLAWIIVTAVLLGMLPFTLALEKIALPPTMYHATRGRFAIVLYVLVGAGITLAALFLELPPAGIALLVLLSIPALVSAWFAGEFYAIFAIRQYFKTKGWDYIAGKSTGKGLKGTIGRGTGFIGLTLAVLAPFLAVNTFIGLFSASNDQGGPIGSAFADSGLPWWLINVLIFILLLGPLISLATQPAGFFELTINSEMYSTLSKFDWEEFNRRTRKAREIIQVRPHSTQVMGGIIALFLSFVMYVAVLSLGGIVTSFDIGVDIGLNRLSEAVKFVEIPIFLAVVASVLYSLVEEREIFDLAELGMKEQRDVTAWTFWVLEHLYDEKYDEVDADLDKLLADPVASKNHRVHFFKGLVLGLQDKNKEAEEYFVKSAELKPSYSDAWMEIGVARYFQGRHDEALEALTHAASMKPSSKTIHYNLGRLYDVMGRTEDALKSYKRALRADREDPKIWANIVSPYVLLDMPEEAIHAGKRALELDPSDHIAKVNLCVAYRQAGQIETSQQKQSQLLEEHPDNAVVLGYIANASLWDEDYQEAMALYDRIQELNGVTAINLPDMALAYYKGGQLGKAIGIVENHISKYPEHLKIRFMLGEMYMTAEQLDKALEQFQFVADRNPAYETVLLKMGSCYGRMGRFDDALPIFEQAVNVLPLNPDVHYNLGLSKSLLGRTDFDDCYAEALRLEFNPQHLSVWLQSRHQADTLTQDWLDKTISMFAARGLEKTALRAMSGGYQALGDVEHAVALLERAVSIDGDPEVLSDLGVLRLEAGEFQAAIDIFQKVTKSAPSVGAFNNLAVAYFQLNNLDGALGAFKEAHELFPDDLIVLQNLATTLTKTEEYAAAVPYYEKILEISPDEYSYRLDYGRCLALVGDLQNARIHITRAMDQANEAGDEAKAASAKEFIGYLDEANKTSNPE